VFSAFEMASPQVKKSDSGGLTPAQNTTNASLSIDKETLGNNILISHLTYSINEQS
jgi:hypothetical protein